MTSKNTARPRGKAEDRMLITKANIQRMVECFGLEVTL